MTDLGRSKWSNDLDDEDAESSDVVKGNFNSLSGLFQMYGKEGKSVRWSDQVSTRSDDIYFLFLNSDTYIYKK